MTGARFFGFLILCLSGLAGAGETRAAKPDPLPPGVPRTFASLYHLMFQLEKGLPYRDFVRTVPSVGVTREPENVLQACRELGLVAKHRKANWSDLLQLKKPFLARVQGGDWLLYKVKDGKLHRLDRGEEVLVVVSEADFLKSWTHDLITAAKPTEKELEKAPRIEFAEKEHDFGGVWQGNKAEHIFGFKNVGAEVLEITNVEASCGCTAVLVSENEIVPGATGTIRVTLNSAGKRHRTESTVSVHTNDLLNPVVALRVKANVLIAAEAKPSQAYFGRVSKGSSLTREIRIEAADDPAFEIRDATCSNPHIQLELKRLESGEASPDAPIYVLKISLDIEGMKYGEEIKDTVVVHTGSERLPAITIRVDATVSGDLFLAPTSLRFAPLYPNREFIRYLILRNNGREDVKIVEVRSGIPGLSFETETLAPGKQYRIKASLKVGDKPEPVEGEVVVVTDHPEQAELRAEVTSMLPTGSGRGSGPE